MATLVQSASTAEPTFRQHYLRQPGGQNHQISYSAAVPVEQVDGGTDSSGLQSTFYKQINIIPGLDADNAVVDTGIKMARPTGGQVQVSTNTTLANEYDGKRMRRSIQRRTVDYNASAIQMIKHRLYKKSVNQKPVVHPDPLYYVDIVQPRTILYNPISSVTTRFVRASTNKIRCPVFTVAWTPEGRRVVTGTSSGEFTLWNGLTFNFETILQAHESAVRAMEWSHNDMWLLSGDHNGVIKYWQSNMNNVKMIQAHTDPIRGVSFCPTDNKFVTCSDDGLLKVWDFYRCQEESVLRGHGADVKCCGWHPTKSLIASGSKDSQQPLKLWDPRSGSSLATIHGHKSTVMDLQWNKNGNWILTGSRDRLLKVYDIRMMKDLCTFRGHKKEAASVNWHPLYEKMFASGGSDGSIMFWLMGCEKELGIMDSAHDGMIWDLKWHPLGHILCSGSNDHTTKFWTRNRPADKMRDKYNLNVLPAGFEDDYEYELPDTEQSAEMSINEADSSINMTPVKVPAPEVDSRASLKHELNLPAVKALIEQASLEVSKPDGTDAPAQVYTLSQLRPTAPAFKIDSSKQQDAINEVERLEKRRERLLKKGIDSKGQKRSADSDEDDNTCNAPSLLDLDIALPAFLQEQERSEQHNDQQQQQQHQPKDPGPPPNNPNNPNNNYDNSAGPPHYDRNGSDNNHNNYAPNSNGHGYQQQHNYDQHPPQQGGPPNDGQNYPPQNHDDQFHNQHQMNDRPPPDYMNRQHNDQHMGPPHDGPPHDGPPPPGHNNDNWNRPPDPIPPRITGEFDLRPLPSPPERFNNRQMYNDNFHNEEPRYDNDRSHMPGNGNANDAPRFNNEDPRSRQNYRPGYDGPPQMDNRGQEMLPPHQNSFEGQHGPPPRPPRNDEHFNPHDNPHMQQQQRWGDNRGDNRWQDRREEPGPNW